MGDTAEDTMQEGVAETMAAITVVLHKAITTCLIAGGSNAQKSASEIL